MTVEMPCSRRTIVLLFLLFFSLRVGIAYNFGMTEMTGDSSSYHSYAVAIGEQSDWISTPSFFGSSREPGYPFFLRGVYIIFGSANYFAVYVLQALIGLVTVYGVWRLAAVIYNERIGILALLWSGTYVHYIWYTGKVLRETLVFAILIFGFLHLWRFLNSKPNTHVLKNINFWIFSLSIGFLIHTDARYLFYLPFLPVLFLYYMGVKRGSVEYLLFACVIIVLMIPWGVRNYIAYDGFVLINSRTLDLRPLDQRKDTWGLRLERNLSNLEVESQQYLNPDYPSHVERALIKADLLTTARSPEEVQAIRDNVLADSTLWQRKVFWLVEYWRPARFSADYFPLPDARFQGVWSLRHNLSGLLGYGVLLLFALWGLILLIRQKNRSWIFLSFPIAVQMILHILMWGRGRYRIPVDAFIIILAAYGMLYLLDMFRGARDQENTLLTSGSTEG